MNSMKYQVKYELNMKKYEEHVEVEETKQSQEVGKKLWRNKQFSA